MEEVCAATGCHLRLEWERVGEQEGIILDARSVAQEWANEFHVRVQRPNAHEVVEAGVELREMLKGEQATRRRF